MVATQYKNHYWSARPGVKINLYHDPRVAIAEHIGWTKPTITRATEWAGLEPDNYNFAVLTTRPMDIPFLDESVIYKSTRNQWYTIFRVDAEEERDVINYLADKDYLAVWRNGRATAIRAKLVLIDK